MNKSIITAIIAATLSTGAMAGANSQDTYLGKLNFVDQTLTKQSSDALQQRIDLQRASQLVVWAMPMAQFTMAIEANYSATGKSRSETPIGLYQGYNGTYPFFTPNGVVPYTIGTLDLDQTGPVILNLPEGPVYGVANNLWQEPIKEFNTFKKGTYLFVGPNDETPADFDGEIIQTETTEILWFFRVLAEDDVAEKIVDEVTIYPYEDRANPPKTEITEFFHDEAVKNGDKVVINTPPSDMGYWDIINRYVQTQPMLERDRFFYAWLADLGIEKGKEFNPTGYQKAVLEEGLKVGLAMAQANSFNKQMPNVEYQNKSTGWHDVLANMDPEIDLDTKSLFDERAAYSYEATTTSSGMVSKEAGKGSFYLGAYYDADQNVLSGNNTYKLNIAADVPAKYFWSVSFYDADTRLFTRNDQKRSDLNSNMPTLLKNEDGTTDMYFAPVLPEGVNEGNWIQTTPDKSFFLYFRSFGPGQDLIDEVFPMTPVERIKAQ